ncbi:MAG: hypothetical protein RLY19_892 [Actinomycetota bacterium]|jgi:hypothetical protein
MPWCEPCAKYFAPSALTKQGHCPDCDESIDVPSINGRITADTLDLKKLAGLDGEKVPWHFKLLVGLLCLYLGWRVIQIFV